MQFKSIFGAASACAIALAAVPAGAVVILPSGFTDPVPPGAVLGGDAVDAADGGGVAVFSESGDVINGPVSAIIGRSGVLSGTWTDIFTFRIGDGDSPDGIGSGGVITTTGTLLSANDLDFVSIFFDNGDELFDLTSFITVTQTANGEFEEVADVTIPIISGNTNQLIVEYISRGNGSFSGTLDFTAVPEPGTWALMLLGFAGIGMSMRRRRKEEVRVKYAF